MNEIDNVELKSPAQWAEGTGIIIDAYDGFLSTYDKLTGIETDVVNPTEYIMRRTTVIPEFIICTRQAFDKALMSCTITMPTNMDYSALSEVAPNFCESSISKRLYGIIYLLQDIEKHGDVPEDSLYTKDELVVNLLKTLESYQITIENNKRLNNVQEEKQLSEIADKPNAKKREIIQSAIKKGGTVEELEQNLIKKLIENTEQVMNGMKDISAISTSQLEALCALKSLSARADRHKSVSIEDQSFRNPNFGKDSQMKMQTFRIIDEDGVHNIVAGYGDGIVVSTETNREKYENAKKKKEQARATMRAVVASAVEDCTQSDIDEVRMIEDKQTKEQEQEEQGNPGEGVL